MKQYSEANGDFTVTGTGWTTTRAVAIPYQTVDGAWRMKFNVGGTVSSAVTDLSLNLSGTVFKIGQEQAITGFTTLAYYMQSRVEAGTGIMHGRTGTARSTWSFSGDVELESKPTWADDSVEVVSYWSKNDTDNSTYYEGDVGVSGNLTLGEGTIRWNNTGYVFYNGTDWQEFASGGDVSYEGTVMKQYLGDGTDFTVSGQSGFALGASGATAIPYQTSDGTWKIILNIDFSQSSSSTADITISGINF
ncbi:MAG: hypothetical protein MI892_10290, partial [Desulfobacterales bacterium]|nr:hypothetical protein [Desulfobacterales bacterium]